MTPGDYHQWIVQLPVLTSEQLNDVRTRIGLLKSHPAAGASGARDFSDIVLEAITDVTRKLNIETASFTRLKKNAAYGPYKAKANDLKKTFAGMTRVQQTSILNMAVELLYNDMLEWGIAVSAVTLMRHIHRLPATINKHFPGYIQSGLLLKLIRRG
jgi:hypothetical protein